MFTLAELDALDVGALSLPARIEASTSVRVYLETFATHTIDPPAWLTNLHHTLRGNLREASKEQEIVAVQAAQRRVWNRLPAFERQQVIRGEIAALEEELRRV